MKDKKTIIVSMVLIFLFTLIWTASSSDSEESPTVQNEDSVAQVVIAEEPVEEMKPTSIDYEIIEENDISYMGCDRASFKVLFADDSVKESIDLTMQEILEEKLKSWDDVTIWAYRESERDIAPTSAHTMGMVEQSTCE